MSKEAATLGRPRKFETVAQLEKLIEEYFKSCFKEEWVSEVVRDKDGAPKVDKKGVQQKKWVKESVQRVPFTVTDLALALDTTRRTLIDYENGNYDTETEIFSHTIKRAKTVIEAQLDRKLYETEGRHTGLIFNLKNNFSWHDRTEIDHSTKDKPLGGDINPQLRELNKNLAKIYEQERKKLL